MDPPAAADEWLPGPRVLEVLEAQAASVDRRVVWRALVLRQWQSSADITPEIVLAPTSKAARWNPRTVSALYTALDRPTAAAEGAQLTRSQQEAGSPERMTLEIVSLEVQLDRVVNLSDVGRLRDTGIDETELRKQRQIESIAELDEPTPAQRIGGACWHLGFAGLLVPSVQRWPTTNLVIFPDRLGPRDYYERAPDV